MTKNPLTQEHKRLDTDLWIILLVTMVVFFAYAALEEQLTALIKTDSIPVILRLLVNAAIQFGVAGLGITIVCILRRERFSAFGLVKKNTWKAIWETILCFLPVVIYTFAAGQFRGYQPFNILITDDVLAQGFSVSILGIVLIAVVWGFFEGFNYAVICEKINQRYPAPNRWLDYGAITCAIVCILFHPIRFTLLGCFEMLTTFIAIYGMLLVKRQTGNAWGCVFAFCFIWNAI